MLHLTLFGGFALRAGDGTEIEVEMVKQRALLAYLAANAGRSIDRAYLAGILWGQRGETRARHSLSQALSALAGRHSALSEALDRTRMSVALKSELMRSDILDMLADAGSTEPSALSRAVGLFQTNVLSEFAFNEAGFDEWATMLREACEQTAVQAGMRYLALDASDRDTQTSRAIARKLLRIDPCNEFAHQALIREHLVAGDVSAALKQAAACRTTLCEELGVEPAPETARLIASIRATRAKVPGPSDLDEDAERERPSIAVLPLQNLTGDGDLSHLCQGLSDDVTTELARYRAFFVISRESAFQASAQPDQLGVVCRRLGVRYALVGSLRPYRGKLRINLSLIEGASGRTIWSERYDVDAAALLDVSDDVIEHLVARLSVSIEGDALARARRNPVRTWHAYDHLLQGLVFHHRSWYGVTSLRGAVKHFTRAVELDPHFARAHAYLACAISAPWYKDRELRSLDRCLHHAELAVQLDPFEAEAHRVMGGVHLTRGEHDLSAHHFRQALRVHPGNAHVLAHAARYHAYVGDNEDAVSLVNRARQLNPLHPAWYWQHLGLAAFGQGEFENAARMFSRLPAPVFYDRLYLSAANAHLGELRVAERHLKLAIRDKSGLDSDSVGRFLPYSHREACEVVISGLRIAGLR